jgi:hypothetical protein
MMLFGCSSGGGDAGGGGGDDGQQPSTSAFNGTFSGDITTSQGGQDSVDTINLSLTVGSPLRGTFFRLSDGVVGTISGDAKGDSATFAGTSGGDCPASFNGSIMLMGNDTLSVDVEGSNCNGTFSSSGELTGVECINIDGTYNVEETVIATCTADGESETDTLSGTATVELEQNGCNVRYVVPGLDLPREGKIEGNNVSFTGPFVIPFVGGVNFTQNTAAIEGTIIDENRIAVNGAGIATGTFEGGSFSCTGDSSGKFTRLPLCDFSSEGINISVVRQLDCVEPSGTFVILGEAGLTSLISCPSPQIPRIEGKINCKYKITGGPRGTRIKECEEKDVTLTPTGTGQIGFDTVFATEDAFEGETLEVLEAELIVQNNTISPNPFLSQFGDSCPPDVGGCSQPKAILVFDDLTNFLKCLDL